MPFFPSRLAIALASLLAAPALTACAAHGEEDPAGFDSIQEGSGGTAGASASGGSASDAASGGTGESGSGGSSATGGSGGSGGSTGGSGGDGGTGGTGGSGGEGGTGGTGGSGGEGGTGGTGGTAGVGGTSGSGGTGGSGGAGGTGGSGGAGGTGGSGGAPVCSQPDGEPNDTQPQAQDLGIINDCDWNGAEVQGKLDGGSDNDWFTFGADDVVGCTVNPEFSVISGGPVLLCAYFSCGSGGTSVTCPSGDLEDMSPGQDPGCCTSKTSMAPSINCSGLDDSSQVYLHAYLPSNNTCLAYSISFHY